jgi:AcrR family transcriptional regulator
MSGLRERQKTTRHRDILAAAEHLFRRDGFRATSIEAIAARANLAIGTLYNYFPSKGDILLALVALDGEEVRAAGAKLIAKPPRDPEMAITRLLEIYVEHSLVHLSKDDWRHALANYFLQSDSRFGQGYAALDSKLAHQVSDLIRALQARAALAGAIDAEAAGRLFFYLCNSEFTLFVAHEKMSMQELKVVMSRQIGIIMSGILAPASDDVAAPRLPRRSRKAA